MQVLALQAGAWLIALSTGISRSGLPPYMPVAKYPRLRMAFPPPMLTVDGVHNCQSRILPVHWRDEVWTSDVRLVQVPCLRARVTARRGWRASVTPAHRASFQCGWGTRLRSADAARITAWWKPQPLAQVKSP